MEPIDFNPTDSESSDWDLDKYKALKDSALNDTATSLPNSRVLPALASSYVSSDTDFNPSDSESSDWDLDKYKALKVSALNDTATSLPNSRVLPALASSYVSSDTGFHGWTLPSSLQPSSSNSRPNLPVGDERLIYEVALQGLNQPTDETTLPDGLLSVSLFRHQKIALAWMLQKENSVACSGGFLADDQGLGKTISIIALIQMQKSSSKPKLEDPCILRAEALDLDDGNDKGTLDVDEDKQAGESDEMKLITKVNSSSSTREFCNRKPLAGSLVVCPASLLRRWARELDEKVADEARLEVLMYHGGNRTKDPAELAKYDVVLTTYSIVAKEVPNKTFGEDDDDDKKDGDGLSSELSNKKRKQSHVSKIGKKGRKGTESSEIDCSGTLAKVHWFRVILDEAQTIKNSDTQVARSCCGLRAKKRWCLSGTPVQNSINELFSYFRFLKCEPYTKYNSFRNEIKIPISRNSIEGFIELQAVLRAIMLRRTKDTLIGGKPIINLPPKTMDSVDSSPKEQAFYPKLEPESSAFKE